MFAPPLNAPLHNALASHVFGRFAARAVPAVRHDSPVSVVSRPRLAPPEVVEDADEIDLAQRVRDLGEW